MSFALSQEFSPEPEFLMSALRRAQFVSLSLPWGTW